MGEKRTVIYKLERHKWPDEIEAEIISEEAHKV